MIFKIYNIERTVIKGIRYKIVTLYALTSDGYFCLGDYLVPARCGDQRLIEWLSNNAKL